MKRFPVAASALLLVAPASAQQPDWSRAPVVQVMLSSHKFAPKVIHLRAGQPVVLHLVNASGKDHDFTAPSFFAAARIRPGEGGALRAGKVELEGHAVQKIALIPTAGRYKLRCTRGLHSLLGMTGTILVD